ncbi:hypothetical protein CPB84DRAFT_1749805 [Gymnopilus junonius]|uniref:Uncharacterized protein n=1 Tax=Gymnopilus junonius TaxID=109634 RepID=A0A9P5TKF2_GYMJU|nr:hypothetical protein CPB84DRAFT_1749805 [Gymnopilus junonius]
MAPTHSKPIQGPTDPESQHSQKRKHILSSRIASTDNMDKDAVKHRKVEAAESAPAQKPPSRAASVEEVEDEDAQHCRNAGLPHNPESLLEAVNGGNDDYFFLNLAATEKAAASAEKDIIEIEDGSESESEGKQEETDEELLERLRKGWHAPIYGFFKPKVKIVQVKVREGADTVLRCCLEFCCGATHCKGKGNDPRRVRRYLDKGDKMSMKNLCMHAIACWGKALVEKADETQSIAST